MTYRFHPKFEQDAVALCIIRPAAWRRVGQYIDPKQLSVREAQVAIAIARDISYDSGAPGGLSVVYQGIADQVEDGNISPAEWTKIVDWLEEGASRLASGATDEVAVVDRLVRTITRAELDSGTQEVIDAWSKGGADAIDRGLDRVARARKLGDGGDRGATVQTLDQRIATSKQAGVFRPLETGYAELDALMGGGRNRGTVGIVAGPTGSGKSQACTSFGAAARARGLNVFLASTEIRPYLPAARSDAALFGVKINDIRADPDILRPLYDVYGDRLGPITIKHFAPAPGQRTTMRDVCDEMDRAEDALGRATDLLVVDLFDGLKPTARSFKGSDYSAGEWVFEEICQTTEDRDLWTWGTCHVQRQKHGALWGVNNLADSQHKARRVDDIITTNFFEGTNQMTINYCKAREGGRLGVVGPYPACFAFGRLIPTRLLDEESDYAGL